ncbi:MAG: hypothetical protein COB33_012920 [Thiotrichaceae bacterium]|nr:hypothetical protein [Thiotrichaceae bacterium]PCI14795.1 MAG: hypothetical protein COB71_01680 [Thiotrichales bacterium]
MFVSVKKRMMKTASLLLVLPLLLVGCVGGENTMALPTKKWDDIHITVQTRPPKVKAGMVEFMVLAAIKGRKPENELVVSLRMEGSKKWNQAIQDGFLGVYRRVVLVRDPTKDVLAVRLRVKKSDKEKILYFPLSQQQLALEAATQ